MTLKDLFSGVFTGKRLKLRNYYDTKGLDKMINSKNVSRQTVTLRNAQTGEITGKRTIIQK